MIDNYLIEIKELYEDQLLNSELEFWLKYGFDKENGGIYTALDRDGSILDTDKSVWFQARALWIYSTAYEKYGNRKYLELATSLVEFIDSHCYDTDGRMYFRVSKEGNPVVKRLRYYFSEAFTIMGYSVYGRITNNNKYIEKAYDLFLFVEDIKESNILIPKMTRKVRDFGAPMIFLNVLSELRESLPQKKSDINLYIDKLLLEIETYFVKDDLKAVLEQCLYNGEINSDHFEGRMLNPGHAIEGSWFIMNEGLKRNDSNLINLGLKMLDWMFDRGWDNEYGGIIQYRDLYDKSLSEYHQDMKFWWPQCECAIALLLAYSLTNDDSYLNKFKMVNNYIQNNFVDLEYGEWFGYLHRDNTLATPLKGNMYKGPFHIPRMYLKCIEIIESLYENSNMIK